MPIYHIQDTLYKRKRKGVQIKAITGDNIQMTFILLEPGFVTEHKHPEEQMGYILSGKIALIIGGEKEECTSGDGYHIPSDILHSFQVLSKKPAELIEIFSPPKIENEI